MLRSTAAEVDTTGPDRLDLVVDIEITTHERPGGETIQPGLPLT